QWDQFDWNCDYYLKHGAMMPENWKDQIEGHDAIFFGSVGWPALVPDHISLWGMLVKFRREFDQYVNLRPVRLFQGVPAPLVNSKPGEIDFYILRENTEGEYSAIGGRMFAGTPREIVIHESVFTRSGIHRGLKFGFELPKKRPRQHLTSRPKSNGISISMPYWDERVVQMSNRYPAIHVDK